MNTTIRQDLPPESLINLCKKGVSIRAISQAYRCTTTTLIRYAKEVLPPELHHCIPQKPLQEQIYELLDQNIPMKEIAEILNCHIATIYTRRQQRQRKWETRTKPALQHCTRCSLPPFEKNVIGSDGICLWCCVEATNWDLGSLVERYGWSALIETFQQQQEEQEEAAL